MKRAFSVTTVLSVIALCSGLSFVSACSTKNAMFNRVTGRPALPQQQLAEENPRYKAQFMQRRRPINNPPSDGDPRYSNMYGEHMLSVPAMQASAPPAGYPGGLPPVPGSAPAAFQGGTAVPQFNANRYPGQQPSYQGAPQGGGMPGQGGGYPPSGMSPQGMSPQGMPMQAPAFSGGGPGFPPRQGNPMQQAMPPAQGGMMGGDDMSGMMPLQLDGGRDPGMAAPMGGGMPYRASGGYGTPQPIPDARRGGAAPYITEPYAPGNGDNYGNGAFMPSARPPEGAQSRLRYATRNQTSQYQSLMGMNGVAARGMSY